MGRWGRLLTGEADVDDEGAALVGAVGGTGDGAGEVGDVGAVVERDGDARHLPVAVALGELLLHARDVHHPLDRSDPHLPSSRRRRGLLLFSAGAAPAMGRGVGERGDWKEEIRKRQLAPPRS